MRYFYSSLSFTIKLVRLGFYIISRRWLNILSDCLQARSNRNKWSLQHFLFEKFNIDKTMVEQRFSDFTEMILREAGWFPGRHGFSKLRLPDGYELYEPTRQILDEFGGLSLYFSYSTTHRKKFLAWRKKANIIIIDPSLCADEIAGGSTVEFSQLIRRPLYPLAVYYDDRWDPYSSNILIDDLGRIFLRAFWTDTFVGATFDIALDNLLAGRKGEFIDENGQW